MRRGTMITTTAVLLCVLAAGCPSSGSSGDGRLPDGVARPELALGDGTRGEGSMRDGRPNDGPRAEGARPPDGKLAPDGTPAAATCAPLAPSAGKVVKVTPAQAAQLPTIIAAATSGTTITLDDGTYLMQGSESQRRLTFAVPGVTLRSASGDRTKVVIDGEYLTSEMVFIAAPDVTIADLTLKRAVYHLVHVVGAAGGVAGTVLYNLQLVDSGEQFVKVNADGAGHFVDNGRLECSRLELTAAGRPHIQTNPGGCYTGGIDAHGAWGWKVRLNRFEGIYCTNGSLAEHAVHFWSASRDTLVERNVIVDCARGIGFGLGQSGATRVYPSDPYPAVAYKGHIDGIVRNNVIHTSAAAQPYYDTGIALEQAPGARVYHNTVVSKALFSAIDYRFGGTTKVELRNNLAFKITQRDGATGTVDHNLENAPASLFVNVAAVDYHLAAAASAAIDKGVALAEAGLDLDGKPHTAGAAPDLGALERQP